MPKVPKDVGRIRYGPPVGAGTPEMSARPAAPPLCLARISRSAAALNPPAMNADRNGNAIRVDPRSSAAPFIRGSIPQRPLRDVSWCSI